MRLAMGILMMLPLVAHASDDETSQKPQSISLWAQLTVEKPRQPGPKKDKPDQELLQGTWAVVCVWHNGKPEEMSVELQLTVAGDKWTVGAKGAIKYLEVAQFRVDATSTPKRLDLTYGAAAQPMGIYELGGDSLKLCVAPPDKPRPTEMVTKEGDQHILVLLKRVKTSQIADAERIQGMWEIVSAKPSGPIDVGDRIIFRVRRSFVRTGKANKWAQRSCSS